MNDYLNRVGRPAPAVNRSGVESPMQSANGGQSKKFKFKIDFQKLIFTVFVVVVTVLIIFVIYFIVRSTNNSTISQVKKNQFQAVFLNSSDGQVYFGKLTQLNKDYYKLTDIYYVRVTSNSSSSSSSSSSTSNQSISLAKLGNEIHGPEDAMFINKNNVMFWENLKDSGQVVTAIHQYEKNGGQTTNSQSTTNSTANTTSNTSTNNTVSH